MGYKLMTPINPWANYHGSSKTALIVDELLLKIQYEPLKMTS